MAYTLPQQDALPLPPLSEKLKTQLLASLKAAVRQPQPPSAVIAEPSGDNATLKKLSQQLRASLPPPVVLPLGTEPTWARPEVEEPDVLAALFPQHHSEEDPTGLLGQLGSALLAKSRLSTRPPSALSGDKALEAASLPEGPTLTTESLQDPRIRAALEAAFTDLWQTLAEQGAFSPATVDAEPAGQPIAATPPTQTAPTTPAMMPAPRPQILPTGHLAAERDPVFVPLPPLLENDTPSKQPASLVDFESLYTLSPRASTPQIIETAAPAVGTNRKRFRVVACRTTVRQPDNAKLDGAIVEVSPVEEVRALFEQPESSEPTTGWEPETSPTMIVDSPNPQPFASGGPMADLSGYKDLSRAPQTQTTVDIKEDRPTLTSSILGAASLPTLTSPAIDRIPTFNSPEPTVHNHEPNPDIDTEFSTNVTTLIRLVNELPEGVTKQTGAQIIRLTMEAMGISMEDVLSDAQAAQSEMLDAVRANIKKIEEYKTVIRKLETDIKYYQGKANELSEIIDLFILSNASSKAPAMDDYGSR